MQQFFEICLAAAICGIVLVIFFIVRRILLTPIPKTDGASIVTVVSVSGDAPQLEQTIGGLLWLLDSGTLDSTILIVDRGLSESGRKMAQLILNDYSSITLCTQDQIHKAIEVNKWMKVRT